jgi:hypothetical protein
MYVMCSILIYIQSDPIVLRVLWSCVFICYFKQFLPPFLKFNYHGIIGPWNTYSLSVYCILVLWNTFLFAGNQFKWFFGLTLIQYELWEKVPLKTTGVRSILLLIYSYYYQYLFLISVAVPTTTYSPAQGMNIYLLNSAQTLMW